MMRATFMLRLITQGMIDGSGLIIKHIGNSKFYDSKSHNHFVMNQLLHVPSITKNLLSVSQFCRDS